MKISKFRHLRWEIQDHIKDAGRHYDFAMEDIHDGDQREAKEQQSKGFERLQDGKKSLEEFSEHIRDCEYKDKHSSMDAQDVSEKYCAWRMLKEAWEKEIEELEDDFEEVKI